MQFKNIFSDLKIEFPKEMRPIEMFKNLELLDNKAAYYGSFYHITKGQRKQMGNWILLENN